MKTPNIKDLVNRYSKCIEMRSEKHVNDVGKRILIAEWFGKEKILYGIVKKMENQDVQNKNIKDNTEIRKVTFQTGCDVLGFATYVTHENVFYHNPKVGSGIIEHRQLEFKEGYKVISITSY
jgi:hypothetical protein